MVLKTVINTILEPLLYGKSAGVLQVPLLIMLAFWTWLWGPIGLILATPLTVSLLVFAKHVPQLEFLNLLMSDQPAMASQISLYQRMLALDYDEVSVIWENFLRDEPPETAYDALLLPALSYAKADRRRGRLSERQEKFIFATAQALQEELNSDWNQPESEVARRLIGLASSVVRQRTMLMNARCSSSATCSIRYASIARSLPMRSLPLKPSPVLAHARPCW